MRRLRDIALSVLFLLVLTGPMLVFACEIGPCDLPSWLTAEDARWLSGGIKDVDVPGPEEFLSGKLQEAIGDEIENRIPLKEKALLANAALQRDAIATANTIFNWDCYPTYFGSSRIYISSTDAVGYIPRREPEGQMAQLKKLGKRAAAFAKRNPNVNVVILAVQGFRDPAASPAYPLVSNCMLPTDQVAAIKNGADGEANIHVVSIDYESLEGYYEDFFKTDHHWNHRGIEHAYNAVATELDLPTFESPGESEIENYRYSGATARWSLDLLEESVSDTDFDFSNLSVTSPDGTSVPYGHEAFYSNDGPGKKYSFYDSYYDFIAPGSVIKGPGNENAVIVSNSFGAGITPYLALNYASTLKTNAIHPSGRDKTTRLENIVDEQNARTVFVVADPTDLAYFQADCPHFFDAVS